MTTATFEMKRGWSLTDSIDTEFGSPVHSGGTDGLCISEHRQHPHGPVVE